MNHAKQKLIVILPILLVASGFYVALRNQPPDILQKAKQSVSEEKEAQQILADELGQIKATGKIIGYLTYARYVVLNDDETARLRGWIVDGPEGEGVPYSGFDGVASYPHKYDVGQRIEFSGKLIKQNSWCGEWVNNYIMDSEVITAPITDRQCFGWVNADTVELSMVSS